MDHIFPGLYCLICDTTALYSKCSKCGQHLRSKPHYPDLLEYCPDCEGLTQMPKMKYELWSLIRWVARERGKQILWYAGCFAVGWILGGL